MKTHDDLRWDFKQETKLDSVYRQNNNSQPFNEAYVKWLEDKILLANGAEQSDSNWNIPLVNACAPNREFKGTLKTYSGFTHSNRNILQIEVSGVENYIGNTLKVGDEVNIQHWR